MPKCSLFPLKTISEDPAHLNSADAELIVTAEDGLDYVVKTTSRSPSIPAAEWIGQSLADACGIGTPQFAQIQLMDGRIGFGSQWDSSVIADQSLRHQIASAIPGEKQLAEIFSAIYAIDLLTYNTDRHFGNYFFVRTAKGIGVKAYDFSRALHYNGWPLPALPMQTNTNTVDCYRSLRVGYPFELLALQRSFAKLGAVKLATFQSWLDQMPEAWMDQSKRSDFVTWWTQEVPSLISNISEGLRNGNYL
jgi:hypothetical protein